MGKKGGGPGDCYFHWFFVFLWFVFLSLGGWLPYSDSRTPHGFPEIDGHVKRKKPTACSWINIIDCAHTPVLRPVQEI